MTKLHISQTFYSVQGEGPRTGKLAVWLRTFGCPLRCQGFFQKEPTKPETYIKSISFDPKSITKLDDFPVVEYGCDTLYAIDPVFKHLRRSMDVEDVKKELTSYLPDASRWYHPKTFNEIDLCITGGEPLLQQTGLVALFETLVDQYAYQGVPDIQIETNATRNLTPEFLDVVNDCGLNLHFNVSPKLFNVSGEDYEWDPKIITSFFHASNHVALKVVINSSDLAWQELDDKILKLRKDLDDSLPPVYIMPVGATYEQQSDYAEITKIASRALDNGYNISGRLHCLLFGNAIDA